MHGIDCEKCNASVTQVVKAWGYWGAVLLVLDSGAGGIEATSERHNKALKA